MSNLSDVMSNKVCLPEKIPVDWIWVELTQVCRPKQWKTISSSEMTMSGYPVFGANGYVGFYTEYNHVDETIAITCRGNTCGTINRIPAKTYITGNSMALDDVEDKIITQDYLYHSLTHRSVSDAISGSAQPQITGNSLKQVRFPLAPLLEQQKIAAILTSVDDVIEKTQAQIDKLKDLKSGMMQELLTKGVGVDGKPHTEFKDSPVGRIPKMWKMAPLSNVCELQVGYAFKSTWFVDAGIKLLRGDNVGFGTATWERTKYLSKHEANNYQDYQLSRGDIIIGMDRTFTKSGVKITKLSIEDTPSLLVQRVGRFLPKSTCDDDFLWQLLRSSQYLDALKGQEKGMDIPHLSKSEILTPYVVIPPLEEQKIIARTLRSVDDMIERNSKKLISNNLLKKALMQDLLTGKVRVTID